MKYKLEIKRIPEESQPIAYLGVKIKPGTKKTPGVYDKIGYLCLTKCKNSSKLDNDGFQEDSSSDSEPEDYFIGGAVNLPKPKSMPKTSNKVADKRTKKGSKTLKIKYKIGNPPIKGIKSEIKLPKDLCFLPLHRDFCGSQRESIYISGRSGQGKSEWISNYLKSYKTLYPDDPIYLFSAVDKDACLDKFDPLRIDLETLIDDPLDIAELENSICIFDDTMSIPDAKMNLAVQKVLDSILEKGRHHNITCLCTSHIARSRNKSTYPINESDQLVFFPRGNQHQAIGVLDTYTHVKSKQIQNHVFNQEPRWMMLCRDGQSYILTKRGCLLL